MVFILVVSLLVVHIEIVAVMSRTQVGSMLLTLCDVSSSRKRSKSTKVTIFAFAMEITDIVQSREMKYDKILTQQSHQH